MAATLPPSRLGLPINPPVCGKAAICGGYDDLDVTGEDIVLIRYVCSGNPRYFGMSMK